MNPILTTEQLHNNVMELQEKINQAYSDFCVKSGSYHVQVDSIFLASKSPVHKDQQMFKVKALV